MSNPTNNRFTGCVRSGALLTVFLPVLALMPMPSAIRAAPPGWWYDRGVLDDTRPPNDFAAVNQGQVKFIAQQAAAELEAHCPGGLGGPANEIQTLLDTWGAPTALTNDFTVVNLGQLKALARPFYDRLIYAKYVTAYPWAGHESLANNYAVANIGQVKNLFAFDLTATDPAHDANANGLPDWWERFYNVPGSAHATDALPWGGMTYGQALQQGLNPVDFFNGEQAILTPVSGDGQSGAPGEFLPLALTVAVTANTVEGTPYVNAPVTFSVLSPGEGKVQRSSNSAPGQTLTVLTDYQGHAKVYFKLPAGANSVNTIEALPGSGRNSSTVTFTERGNGVAGTNPSPFDPSNVVATMNRDGSADVSWTNNADPTDTESIDLMYKDRNGQWQVLQNVPAGTISCHIPAPQ